jgi:tellurite resistance protein
MHITNATESRLVHMPVSLFAMVMGIAGLSVAYFRASPTMPILTWSGYTLAGLASAIFIGLLALYVAKLVRFPAAIREEFDHPVRLHFFPAITIGALLLSIALAQPVPALAHTLFLIAAPAHLLMTLLVLSQWFYGTQFQQPHINPAWFIPIVGNILVPIPAATFGYSEAGWFFFSIGIVFWPVLLTLFLHRMLFQPALTPRMMPTIFILIPPPAIGFIAYIKLTQTLDGFARILFFTAVFMTLLAFSQLNRLRSIPFFVSWWAYSFPLAAITIATLVMHEMTGSSGYLFAGLTLLAVSSFVIAGLLLRTALAAFRHQICIPE